MSFIARWLKIGTTPKVGLRPHRDLELALDYDAAYDRVLEAIELVLGATVAIDDRRGGLLEAAFGLVNSERVRCTLQRLDAQRTAVRIEALFAAGVEVPESSRAVDALSDSLTRCDEV
ncbi:MAG TPA: hypothetical protein VNG31_08950 [Candidatus Baltobacteraceae bacterium]|nr:hypothetical protein [Candidatus Baltobacteraceae bacterium]